MTLLSFCNSGRFMARGLYLTEKKKKKKKIWKKKKTKK